MRPNNPSRVTVSSRRREKTLDEQLAELFEIEVSAPPVYQFETVENEPAVEAVPAVLETPIEQSRISYFAERFIFILLAMGVFCSIGGFFLFVPILPTFTIAVLLSGALAMFWIGLQLGSKRWCPVRK